jgi:hypothetical protein
MLGGLHEAVAYLFSRPAFSVEELAARFPYLPEPELRAAVANMEKAGLIAQAA